MRLKCEKCGYEWDYKGRMTHYATCPNCRRAVEIRKQAGEERRKK